MEQNGGIMHKCVRCGRAATSLKEINDGCPCGSKVFVFNKDAVEGANPAVALPSQPQVAPPAEGDAKLASIQLPIAPAGGVAQDLAERIEARDSGRSTLDAKGEEDGKAPESYHARMTFTTEDVENIKVLTEGVFALSLQSLSRDPVVLKDEEGIYYVKIPFEQNSKALKELHKEDDL